MIDITPAVLIPYDVNDFRLHRYFVHDATEAFMKRSQRLFIVVGGNHHGKKSGPFSADVYADYLFHSSLKKSACTMKIRKRKYLRGRASCQQCDTYRRKITVRDHRLSDFSPSIPSQHRSVIRQLWAEPANEPRTARLRK